MDISEYFCDYEGYLTNRNQTKILFILKEPNSNGKEANTFWMREVVEKDSKIGAEKKYFSKLGKIACLLLNENEKEKALEQCAYINLQPKSGKGTASKNYRDILKSFKKDNPVFYGCNRWNIIDNLTAGSVIVTISDISDAIKTVAKRRKALTRNSLNRFILRNIK